MKAKILAAFIFLLPALAFSQDNFIYPNTTELIWNNGVKKQTIITEEKSTGKKHVSSVLFFDSSSNCIKFVYRDYTGKYRFNSWSKNNRFVTWEAFGYYDTDSTEVISSKTTTNFDALGRTTKRETISLADNGYYKNGISFSYPDSLSREGQALNYRIDINNDTSQKSFILSSGKTTTSYSFQKNKGQWIEEFKIVSVKDEQGRESETVEYRKGKLFQRTETKYLPDNRTELTVFDSLNQLTMRSVHSSREISYTYYEKGKIVREYAEALPIADPPNENPVGIAVETDDIVQTKSPAKKSKPEPAPVKKPLQVKAKTVKQYADNDPSKELILIQDFGTNGLMIRQEDLRNGQIHYWTYDYF